MIKKFEGKFGEYEWNNILVSHSKSPLDHPMVVDAGEENDLTFLVIDCLKYLARKHGLSSSFGNILLTSLTSTSTISTIHHKYRLVQIIKYSTCHTKMISVKQYVKVITTLANSFGLSLDVNNSNGSSNNNKNVIDPLVIHTVSLLTQSLLMTIDDTNSDSLNDELFSSLRNFLSIVDANTKVEILKKLSSFPSKNQDGKRLDNKGDNVNKFWASTTNDGIFESGDLIINKLGAKNSKKVVADAVKTQQVVMSCYKQNMSESNELENLNLSNALNKRRGKSTAKVAMSVKKPGRKGGSGSDRGWWSQIDTLSQLAGNKPLTEPDIVWLASCTDYSYTSIITTYYQMEQITGIFYKIVDYQAIGPDIMSKLTVNFFSENLSTDFEKIRITMLRTIDLYSKQLAGKLPEAMSNTLDHFQQNFTTCTRQMKRIIWSIMMQDDANLYESFKIALEEIKTCCSSGISSEDLNQSIDYIGRQTVLESRSLELEEKFKFLLELVNVVLDKKYGKQVRIRCAEIVEDFLTFDKKGLSRELVAQFLSLAKSGSVDGEFFSWTDGEQKLIKSTLTRCVLKTLGKITNKTDAESLDLNEETLADLVRLGTKDENLELEAFIVISLGNLINVCPTLHIPNAELLLGKLCRSDRICKDTSTVNLKAVVKRKGDEKDGSEYEESDDDDYDDDENLVYISGHVANIILRCVDKVSLSQNVAGIRNLVNAVQNSRDKMTRILSAQILFEISSTEKSLPLSTVFVSSLKPFTMHSSVYDVQVYCTASYCINMEKVYGSCGSLSSAKRSLLSDEDCDLLTKLYAIDASLTLGNKNFAEFVNQPILNILKEQGKFIKFSHDTFQLLTFLLNEDLGLDAEVLEILENSFVLEVKEPRNICPEYLFASIENIFERQHGNLFETAGKLMQFLSRKQNCLISGDALDHAYQGLMSINEFSSIRLLCFKILFTGFCSVEIPQHIFHAFDSEFLVSRILHLLPTSDHHLDAIMLYSLGEKVHAMTEEVDQPNKLIHFALDSLHEYQSFGRRLSYLHWTVFGFLLNLEPFHSHVIRCLIVASENCQSVPSSIIKMIFTSFTTGGEMKMVDEETYQLDILSLALSIVQNNQILPPSFVAHLVERFSKDTAQGVTVGDSEIYDQILTILTNLAKLGKPLPKLKNVTQHLCNLYVNSKKINQKMGVVLKWKSLKAKTKKEMSFEEAAEIIGRLCKFWKKSRNHKYRLEILSGLYGIIGSELRNPDKQTVNLGSVKHCLVLAMTDKNLQTLESGVQTFLLLNSRNVDCSDSDFQLLLSIHSQPNLNRNLRRQLGSFLYQNFDRIPKVLQTQYEFDIELEQLDNKRFLGKLFGLLEQTGNFEIFQENPIFFERFLAILSASSHEENEEAGETLIVCQVVEILAKMPMNILATVPYKLMDAVAILLSSTSKKNIVRRCNTLLVKYVNVDKNVRIKCLTLAFFEYLTMSKVSEVLRIGVQILESQFHLFKEKEYGDILKKLKFQLETRTFLNASVGPDPDQVASFIKHISTLNYYDIEFASNDEFHQVVRVYLVIMDTNMVHEDGRLVLLKLLLLNFVKCFHSQLDIEELTSFSEIVQNTIQQFDSSLVKHVNVCILVALSYTILVSKGCIEELASCLRVFTNLSKLLESKKLSPPYRHVHQAIFAGISSTVQFVCEAEGDHDIGKVISEVTVHLIEDNLANQCPTIRLLAFRALLSLESHDMTAQSSDGVGLISGHILKIYSQIFSNKELAMQEMEKDMSFTSQVAELLFTISFWDLKSLKEEDRGKWKRVLLTTNFITQFGKSDYEKLELMMRLRYYFNRVCDSVGDDREILQHILWSLTLCLTKEKPVPTCDQVINILNLVEMIPNDQLAEILERQSLVELNVVEESTSSSKPCGNFVGQLETTILINNVKKLMSNSSSNLEILQKKVSALTTSTGNNFKLTYDVLQMINDDVTNINTLNELVDILKKISGVDQSFEHVQNNIMVPRPKQKYALKDFVLLLQSHFLLLQISQKTGEKQQKLATGNLGNILKNLLKNGLSLEQIQNFICLTLDRTSISGGSVDLQKFRRIFDHVVFQLSQYRIKGEQLFNQLMLALKNSDSNWHPSDIINICNNTINNYVFHGTQGGRKQLDNIFDEFKSINPDTYSYFLQLETKNWHEIGQIFDKVNNKEFVVGNKEISAWTKSDIANWALGIKSGDLDENKKVSIVEALVVGNQAFHLVTTFYLTDIQILTCLIALSDKANGKKCLRSGQLFQVSTGSGKSAIVGIISALTCMLDRSNGVVTTIDIFTSSLVLAQRDAREWTEIYSIFGLTCGHNGDVNDRYISGEKLCYRNDIVYGDCSQFQFDYLRHHYSNLGTLGARTCSFAVIDEVDTMLIDDSSKLARLSSTIPGMDLVQVLYHCIWDRLTFIKNHLFTLFGSIFYLEGQIKVTANCVSYAFAHKETNDLLTIGDVKAYIAQGGDLEKARIQKVEVPIDTFVAGHLEKYALTLIEGETSSGDGGRIKLPLNLKSFAKSQISSWVESSLQAVAYQENVNYIVDDGQIKPVDFKTTGVIQGNTSWNNGLHQFLQIKHGLKLTAESVTTNYLSNIATFQKYGTNVVGFTGTLGSPASQTVLTNVYNVKLCLIPEICFKRYVRFPDIVTDDRESWLNEITLTSLQETSKRRGVLVICETIREAELVHATLTKFTQLKVKVYVKNQDDQEKQIERIHPGDIIVATNLAGRGTDIKTADIESYGGLHVILSFLPASLRIDEQAFGRTSRQGKNGTGQLIIVGSEYYNDDGAHTTVDSEMLILQRDNAETDLLKQFSSTELPVIQLKDKLFDKFSETFKTLRNKLREQNSSWCSSLISAATTLLPNPVVNLVSIASSPIETIHLQAVEERWAMFLRSVESMYNDGKDNMVQVEKEFTNFSDQLLRDFETESLVQNSNNLYYFIQLGNYEYMVDTKYNQTLDSAKKYFDCAINLDNKFSVPAIVGKALLYLKGRENKVEFNSHESNYKESALKLLNDARPMLYDELAILNFVQVLIQRQHGNESTKLENQIIEKVNLYGTYLKNVEATIDIVQKSLRQVRCSGTMTNQQWNGDYTEAKQLPDSLMTSGAREIPKDFSHFERYDLTFNDLAFENEKDQIALTVQVLCKPGVAEKAKAAFKNLFKKIPGRKVKKDDYDDEMVKDRYTKVSFSLKNVDPHKVLTELTNNKDKVDVKKFQFHVHALDLDMTSKDRFKSIVSSFKLLEPTSYALILTLDTVKTRGKVLTFLKNLKEFEVSAECDNYTKSTTFTDHSENPASIKQLDTFLDEIRNSGQFTIKIFRKSADEINIIAHVATSSIGLDGISNTSLTVNNVSKTINDIVKKKAWEKILDDCTSGVCFVVETVDENQGVSVVPILRQFTFDIVLSLRSLPLEVANFVLKDARVTQEDITQQDIKELTSTYCSDRLPLMELRELSARGVTLIVTFNELKFVPWGSVLTIAGLAAVQAAAGGVLITTGFGASLGMSLINEGMSDLVAAHRIYNTREFSWSQYGTQKAISLTISAVSLGMSGLKDGAKGIGQLVQGGVSDSVVQAGKSVATGQMLLNTTIEHAGKNLQSLALKQVGISVVETGGRIALKSLADSLTDFCFEQVRDGISKKVQTNVNLYFLKPEFKKLLSFHFVLNKKVLENKLLSIVNSTTNPKSSVWHQQWNSIGLPLCQGILSSPQFLGSTVSRLVMVTGFITGLKELNVIIDKVCLEILKNLEESKPSLSMILHSQCGLAMDAAENIASKFEFDRVKFEAKQIPSSSLFDSKEEYENVVTVWKRLESNQKSLDVGTDTTISRMQKSAVDAITAHLIRVTNSHFVSPVMSAGVGTIVAKISTELQDRFLVNHSQSTDEQLQSGEKETFASQIQANAKVYMLAWQKREIIAKIQELPTEQADEKGDTTNANNKTSDGDLKKYAEGVIEGKDADMVVMFTLAKKNGAKIKIVDDKNYQPTAEDVANGVQIVIYEKNSDPSKSGHYSLRNPDGSISSPVSEHDCGYMVMSKITGKSVDELRVQAATTILQNPSNFTEIQSTVTWIQNRYLQVAVSELMAGGARKSIVEPTKAQMDEAVKFLAANCEAFGEAMVSDLKDGPGVIYIYRRVDADGNEIDDEHLKIGRTEQQLMSSDKRVGQSEKKNTENYKIVAEFSCEKVKAAEKYIHAALNEFRKPRTDPVTRHDRDDTPGNADGYTEYFRTSDRGSEFLIAVSKQACKHINYVVQGPGIEEIGANFI